MDLVQRFILNICGSFFIIFILTALAGCANKDVARKDYAQGDYKSSYAIWKQWVDKGYYDDNIRLLKILQKNGKDVDYKKIKKMALDAYNAGEKKAAYTLEGLYIAQGNLKEAYLWMRRGVFALSSLEDFKNHLYIIENYNIPTRQQKVYLKQLEDIAKNNNVNAAIALGGFYARAENPFYDLRRSEYFYQKAYNLGNQEAGAVLAKLYIYNFDREKEGLDILQLLSKQGNGKASYEIGNFMLHKVDMILQKKNSSCIATSFTQPHEFYLNKMYTEESRRVYITKNVIPWYKKAYEQNYLDGMLKLIAFDLQEDNFNKTETFSQMNLKEAEAFLQQHKENKKAVMLLARLYQNYPRLGKFDVAETIYLKSMEDNTTAATWNLYKLYKNNDVNSPQANAYLKELVAQGFKPAVIEYSYKNLLKSTQTDKNIKILMREADAGNEEALKDLVSLYNNDATKNIDYLPYLEKLCKKEPNNKSIDMKIADYYLKNNNINKGATILQYYAESGDNAAQYKLSKLYGKLNMKEREAYWAKAAKDNGNIKAAIAYNTMVLKGMIKGNVSRSVQTLNNYAKAGNVDAIRVLAQAYSTGSVVDFDPKVAKSYYLLLIQKGDPSAYLGIIDLYQKINIDQRYDNSIEQFYQMAINNNVNHAKVKYAKFLISREKISKAKKLLLSVSLKKEPVARVLLYKITGKEYYLNEDGVSNNGELLMQYAQKNFKYSKRKALLYAFRAELCNTPSTGTLTYNLMRYINNSRVIENIYQKAKSYPRCTNQ